MERGKQPLNVLDLIVPILLPHSASTKVRVMKSACRCGAAVVSLVTVVLLGALPLGAEESTPAKPSGVVALPKRTHDPSRRVPDYFGGIGLTSDQKEAIYKIRGKHLHQIEDLEKQIAQAKAQMLAECETLLTDTQKQLLEHRRRSADETKKVPDPPGAVKESKK
jgi:hypothetical protein